MTLTPSPPPIRPTLQSPDGAFSFATLGRSMSRMLSAGRGCNPLTGLFLLQRASTRPRSPPRSFMLQSPDGAFSFATKTATIRVWRPGYGCNPLTGLFLLQRTHKNRRSCLRGSLRCNPLTGLFLLQPGIWLPGRRVPRTSCNPLTGLFLLQPVLLRVLCHVGSVQGCNPLTGLFLLQPGTAGITDIPTFEVGVAIP